MPKKLLMIEAVATLIGMIIGAGILGIPYVVAKAGFWTGMLNILILGIVMLLTNLFVGEICLRTKKMHQLSGYTEKYMGKKAGVFMMILFIVGMYGALIAYIIQEGVFLKEIFSGLFDMPPIVFSIIFFTVFTLIVYLGLKAIEDSEVFMVGLICCIVLFLLFFAFKKIDFSNLTEFSIKNMFIPFGVVFFAFMGTSAMPAMREELKGNEKLMKNAILLGSSIPIIIYMLFSFIVVGISGKLTTEGAMIGLKNFLGFGIFIISLIFGVLTMGTSFLTIGLGLNEMYKFDYKLNRNISIIFSCFVPFAVAVIIMIMKVSNAFYKVLDLTGAIVFPMTCIMIVLTYWKAKKFGDRKPEYSLIYTKFLGIILIIIFLMGMVYELLKIYGYLGY